MKIIVKCTPFKSYNTGIDIKSKMYTEDGEPIMSGDHHLGQVSSNMFFAKQDNSYERYGEELDKIFPEANEQFEFVFEKTDIDEPKGLKVKQVIVWRKDLKVRKGKMMAQAAHASLAVILGLMRESQRSDFIEKEDGSGYIREIVRNLHCEFREDSYLDKWINGRFTKICVSCEDERELLRLDLEARSKNIPVALITDAGLTEFNGVPTNTCIAIGPFWSEEIDEITGKLKLL